MRKINLKIKNLDKTKSKVMRFNLSRTYKWMENFFLFVLLHTYYWRCLVNAFNIKHFNGCLFIYGNIPT